MRGLGARRGASRQSGPGGRRRGLVALLAGAIGVSKSRFDSGLTLVDFPFDRPEAGSGAPRPFLPCNPRRAPALQARRQDLPYRVSLVALRGAHVDMVAGLDRNWDRTNPNTILVGGKAHCLKGPPRVPCKVFDPRPKLLYPRALPRFGCLLLKHLPSSGLQLPPKFQNRRVFVITCASSSTGSQAQGWRAH